MLVQYADVTADTLPGAVEPGTDSRPAGWFDSWGLTAVAVTNLLPVTRGSLTVPAAMTDEDLVRFSASSMVGTSVYAAGLLAVAAGIDAAVSLL